MNDWGGYSYNLQDLAFDSPKQFGIIFRTSIEASEGFGFDPYRVWAHQIEAARIWTAQRRAARLEAAQLKRCAFDRQVVATRTNRYDMETAKIKRSLLWSGLQPPDTVAVVFWQDIHDPLVSFARRTKRQAIVSLLDVTYEELRNAGFSGDYITKMSAALRDWAGKLLNQKDSDIDEQESVQPDSEEEEEIVGDIASSLLSMFFADDEAEGDGGDSE